MTTRLLTIGIFAACFLSLVGLELVAHVRPMWVTDSHTLFARLMARRAAPVAVSLGGGWLGGLVLVWPPQ
jgi:hypothetical protein